MQINKQKSKQDKRNIVIINALAVVIIIAAGILLYKNYFPTKVDNVQTSPSETSESQLPSDEAKRQAETDLKNKTDFLDKQQDSQEEKVPQSNPPSDDTIILSAQTSGDSVIIRVNVGTLTTGTCTLDVVNGTRSTTQTAKVLYQPQTSTCAGFSVPVSSVGTGEWSIKVTVESEGKSASKTLVHATES